MSSEENLIKLIKEDNPKTDFSQACKYKINQFKGKAFGEPRIILIRIILLLYSNGHIEFGEYLSPYKDRIIELMLQGYQKPKDSILLFLELLKNEKFGILLYLFKEVEKHAKDYLYDFFKILLNEKAIKDILDKYLIVKIGKMLPNDMEISNITELIELIYKSNCFQNKHCDYNIFYNYLMEQYKIDKAEKQKKKIEKKILKKNINKSEIKDNKAKDKYQIQSKEEDKSKENNLNVINNKIGEDSKEIKINSLNNNEEAQIDENANVKDIDEIEDEPSILLNYYNERKEHFSKMKYETPFLDKLINKEIQIEEKLFLLKKPKQDYLVEPHYINLKKVIDIFNDPQNFVKNVIKEKKYGYFCYRKYIDEEYRYIEGIYAILDNSILYQEITKKNKFEKDDINESNKSITDNCFKARGLSLEYYLNGIFMDLFNQKELPRAIYNFDPALLNAKEEEEQNLNRIEESTENEEQNESFVEDHYDKEDQNENRYEEEGKGEENLESYEKKDNKESSDLNKNVNEENNNTKKRIIEMEEIDGVFYLENDMEIKVNELPFIIDDILEIQNSKFEYTAENIDFLKFKRKSLLLLEVKNRFPENNYLVKEIKKALSKSMTFYHLFEERYKNIEKLRIMFFYNVIPKKNYDEILTKTVKDYFGRNNIKNKIQFQFIFITSSYLAYNFKNLKDKTDDLENKYQNCNAEIIELRKKVNSLSKALIKHGIKYEDEKINENEKDK